MNTDLLFVAQAFLTFLSFLFFLGINRDEELRLQGMSETHYKFFVELVGILLFGTHGAVSIFLDLHVNPENGFAQLLLTSGFVTAFFSVAATITLIRKFLIWLVPMTYAKLEINSIRS